MMSRRRGGLHLDGDRPYRRADEQQALLFECAAEAFGLPLLHSKTCTIRRLCFKTQQFLSRMVVPNGPQLYITVQLLLLLYLFSAVLAGSVVAQGFTSTTVCDATTATANANRNATVLLENGTTYVVKDCTITMMFITDDNNSVHLLHDVAIVVRGGSALPVVVVRAATVRNVTVDLSDVVYDAASSAAVAVTTSTQVIFLDQIVTAENISISLTNVQIYNALDVAIVNATVAQSVIRFSVVLVNCKLRNVTTSGLVVVKGQQDVTSASSLSFTTSGGTYSLLFIPGKSDTVMMRLQYFLLLSNAVMLAHNGVAIQVTGVSNRTMSIGVSIVAQILDIHTVSSVHILIERADVVAVPALPSLATFDIAGIHSISVSLNESSVSVKHSRVVAQSAGPRGLKFATIGLMDSVVVEVLNTSMELITYGMQGLTVPRSVGAGLAQSVMSTAVSVGPIDHVVDCIVVISDCYLRLVAMNMSSLQNYSTVTCAAVALQNVSKTSALVVNVTRVIINVTAQEASVALYFNPYTPVVGLLSLTVAGFVAFASVLERSILSIKDSTLFSDVILIPPVVPTAAYPLMVAPLLAADVSVALLMSTSDWTNSNISVHRSRVVVQQLRFLLQSPVVPVGSASNDCDAIHLSNSTGMILFHSDPVGLKRCLPALVTSILPFDLFTTKTLTAVRLAVTDCEFVISTQRIVQSIQPQLLIAPIFLPAAVIGMLISVSNVSSAGQASLRTGPVIALSGTVVAGLNATMTRVTGFPLGILRSDLGAGSTIQSSNILAVAVDADEGGVVAGNVTAAAAALTVTLRNCVLGGGLFGDSSTTRWLAASYDSAMTTPSSVIVLQECNTWNGRPLTLPLARRLLREADNSVSPGAVTVRMGDENNGNCVVTATLEVIPPQPMPRVSSTTGAVAVAAMALSAISAPSTASVASMMRLQAIFGSLRVGRRCYQATSGAATNDDSSSSSESDDVGSAVFDNPLQLSIPVQDSSLQYAAGCVIGNTILFLVAMIVLNLQNVPSTNTPCQRSFLRVLDHIPGNAFTVMLLLLTPTVTSGTALSSASTMLGGVACVVVYGFGSIASIVLMLWRFPLRSVLCKQRQGCHATMFVMITALQRWLFAETHGWVPSREALPSLLNPVTFRHRFGVLFVGYRSGCHWYAAVDVAVPVLTGVLCGLPSGSVSCSLVLYGLLGLSMVACMGSVLLRPCMTRWDNVWAMVGNGFSLVVTALILAVRMDAANTVTTALAWMSLVPTLTSVSQLLYRLYLTFTITAHRNNVVADSLEVMVVSPDRNRRRHVDGSARDALCPGSLHDTLMSIVDVERKKSANESLLLLLSLICTNKRHV